MLVAVIDDGVNTGYFSNVDKLTYDLEITDSLHIKNRFSDVRENTHGTNCAAILKKYAPEAEIVSIKALDNTRRGSAKKMAKALLWCLENNISIINLSVGSVLLSDYYIIQPVITKLVMSGFVIIAAMSNDKPYSIIADIFGVIRVREDITLKNKNYYLGNRHPLDADFYASSSHDLPIPEEEALIMRGNSYAAPYITALVYNILRTAPNVSVNYIKQKLRTGCSNKCDVKKQNLNSYPLPNFTNNLLCIGFEKKDLQNFNYTGDFINDLSIKINNRRSILINPSMLYDNQIKQFLNKNKDYITGIIYAGKAPGWLLNYCLKENCFFWDEEITKKRMIYNLENNAIDIPVIIISSKDKGGYALSRDMSRYFTEKEYPSLCVSDKPLSYLYNILYFPDLDEKLINDVCNLYELSVLMINTDNIPEGFIADIYINVNNQITITIDDKKKIFLNSENVVSDLTDYIISISEGE